MKRFVLALVLIVLAEPAEAGLRPLPESTCKKVRWGVAAFGPEIAIQWAKDQGYTSVQIVRAKRCLTAKGEGHAVHQ